MTPGDASCGRRPGTRRARRGLTSGIAPGAPRRQAPVPGSTWSGAGSAAAPPLAGRRSRRGPRPAPLRPRAVHGRPPVAGAQAARAAGVRQARRAQLVGDPEDPLVVGPAGRAAGRPDELRLARQLGDLPERGRHALAVEGHQLVGRWQACRRLPRRARPPAGGGSAPLRPSACRAGPPGRPAPRRPGRGPGRPRPTRRSAAAPPGGVDGRPERRTTAPGGASAAARASRSARRAHAGARTRRSRRPPRSGRSPDRPGDGRRSGAGSSGTVASGPAEDRGRRRSSGRRPRGRARAPRAAAWAPRPPPASRPARRRCPGPEATEGTRSEPPRFVGPQRDRRRNRATSAARTLGRAARGRTRARVRQPRAIRPRARSVPLPRRP